MTDHGRIARPHAEIGPGTSIIVQDESFMRRAIEIAEGNLTHPFGAAMVDTETWEVVAEVLNSSHLSPVRHGEIDAIEICAEQFPHVDWLLFGSTLQRNRLAYVRAR